MGDDSELMRRTGAGDAVAFRTLVERHGARSLAMAERTTGNRADAEEIVQDAFLRVWRAAPDWQPRAKFSTWLYRVVMNLCIDRRRRPPPAPLEMVAEAVDPAPDGERTAARRQLAGRVRSALAELPDRQRAALVLCHYEGFTMAEAADVLDASEGAIESLLFRARSTLRTALDGLARDYLGNGNDHG